MTKQEIQQELEDTTTSVLAKGYQVTVATRYVFATGTTEDEAVSKLVTDIKANLKYGSTYPLVLKEIAKVDRRRRRKKKEVEEEDLAPVGLAQLVSQNLNKY